MRLEISMLRKSAKLIILIWLLPVLVTAATFEQTSPNSFKFSLGKWRTVYIGDSTASYLKPEIVIDRWDGECRMKVGYPTKLKIPATVEGDKVIWSSPDIEIQMFALPESLYHNGGAEFLIKLSEPPQNNEIVLNIESENVRFVYQPPLTEEEKAQGCHRPDSVVGSYSIYHAIRQPMHRANTGDPAKYQACKFGHVYTPEAEDAEGKRTWCGLNIADGKMTITVPQDWLDQATYPVTVDPTFGYTTAGGTDGGLAGDIFGSLFTGAAGTVDSLTAYVHFESGGPPTANSKCAVYLHSDSSLVCQSVEKTSESPEGWHSYEVTGSPEISAVDYVLVAWSEGITYNLMWYDIGDTDQSHKDDESYNGWPNPAIWVLHSNWKFSIYCTYTSEAPPEEDKSIERRIRNLREGQR